MISNDFQVLRFSHPEYLTRDTARTAYANSKAGLPPAPPVSLPRLAGMLLGQQIQRGEHDSVEDARATMAIYRLVAKEWEADLQG